MSDELRFSFLDKLQGMKEPVEVLSRFLLSTAGLSFVAGLLIVDFHLRRFGIFSASLAKAEYVMAGALWLGLTTVSYVVASSVLEAIRDSWRAWKGKRWVRAASGVLLAPMFSLTAAQFFVSQVSERKLSYDNKQFWVITAVMAFTALFLKYLIWSVKGSVDALAEQGGVKKASFVDAVYLPLQQVFFLFSTLALYAGLCYPHFAPVFGGGYRPKGVLLPRPEYLESLRTLDLPVSLDGRFLGPIDIVFETDSYIYLASSDGKKDTRCIRLRQDLFIGAKSPTRISVFGSGEEAKNSSTAVPSKQPTQPELLKGTMPTAPTLTTAPKPGAKPAAP